MKAFNTGSETTHCRVVDSVWMTPPVWWTVYGVSWQGDDFDESVLSSSVLFWTRGFSLA